MSADSLGLLEPEFLARLQRLEIVAKKVVAGELRGELRSRRRGVGSLFRDYKSYAQGDDLRFLDWNVYSRLGELLIKQFEAEENLDLLLVVDASGGMDFGDANKFDHARRVAAALGFVALGKQASVRLAFAPRLAKDEAKTVYFGARQLQPFLQRLEDHPGAGEQADFFETFSAAVGRRKSRGLAIVLSDFMGAKGYEKGLKFLRHQGYRVGAIQVLDRRDLHPGLGGRLRLMDLESNRNAKGVVSKKILKAYEDEVRRWCENVARYCRRQGIDLVTLDTSLGLEASIRELLSGGLIE
ncbi:MAG: DUF58 domain-containing protein [Planctomycetota bacterium]